MGNTVSKKISRENKIRTKIPPDSWLQLILKYWNDNARTKDDKATQASSVGAPEPSSCSSPLWPLRGARSTANRPSLCFTSFSL